MRNWIFLVLLLLSYPILPQDLELLITGSYQEVEFEDFIQDFEHRYPVRFYYSSEWTKDLRISAEGKNTPLSTFLKQVFENTSIQCYIHTDGRIILTFDYEIIPSIRSNFLNSENQSEDEEVNLDIFDPILVESNSGELNNLESKPIIIGNPLAPGRGVTASVSGYVKDFKSGEGLVGASVFKKEPLIGTNTDTYGYFVLNLPKGEYDLLFQSVGMKDTKRRVIVYGDGRFDVEMSEDIISLTEVVVLGEKDNVESIQTGLVKLTMKDIKTIPTILGEADVMKIVLTQPGVQSVGEGASGFNVRGGATDQNLILLDDGLIYNPNHLFGFFSAFNPDVLKSTSLYKSGIQAQYGGRISSVFDVSLREGNKKKFTVTGGISPVTGRITVEGPIKKDTSSFILGVRSTYSNWVLNLIDVDELKNSQGSFSDFITKVNHQIDEKNDVTLSAYHSRDNFKLNTDTLYSYFNTSASFKWRHAFSPSLFGLLSASYTNYLNKFESKKDTTNAFDSEYKINQANIKLDFNVFRNSHDIKFGIGSIFYNLTPTNIAPIGEASVINAVSIDEEKAIESSVYIGDEFTINRNLSIYGGIRVSTYSLKGPGQTFIYDSNFSKSISTIRDTINFSEGENMETYWGPEYRFSMRYKLLPDLSVKLSYDRTRQYIHRLTNTVAVAPTDSWRLSNSYLPPQIGDQYSIGFYKSFFKGYEISLEGYYKEMQNLIAYKDGADLVLNQAVETDVISASGRSYGVEVLLKKNTGKLNGWISYTFSRAFVQAESKFEEEVINRGEEFPASYDKPHNLSVIANYKFSRRANFSLNFTYSTGRPVTFPITKYQFNGSTYAAFSDRNQFQIPDYLRLDVALNLEGNHKIKKLAHGSWSLSVYNLTGRNNAYSIFSRTNGGTIEVFQLSVFDRPIPTITYNFKF